jgi:ubiquitin-like 1-activating enzyme E1 B
MKRFSISFFQGFDMVINALDNLDARRHVSYMCYLTRKPCVETGTAGYHGQVTLILPGATECFSCQQKPAPTTYPVCTIRNTPSTIVHCVVWAKNYLLEQVIGSSINDTIDTTGDVSDVQKELLDTETREWNGIRSLIVNNSAGLKEIINKAFENDIIRLGSITDLWKDGRIAPKPLSAWISEDLLSRTMDTRNVNRDDMLIPTVLEALEMLVLSFNSLIGRKSYSIEFDKDDDPVMDFVYAAANIRACLFSIQMESRFKIKAIAGNIIPAIPTTNAVIAGLACLYIKKYHMNTIYYVPTRQDKIMVQEKIVPPNFSGCSICSKDVFRLYIPNMDTCTLEDILQSYDQTDVSIIEDSRLIYDPDFIMNKTKSLSELNLGHDHVIQIIPEQSDEPGCFCIIQNTKEPNIMWVSETLDSQPNKRLKV